MVTWNAHGDTLPLHTVLIVSDQPDHISTWEPLFQQRNCIVLSETKASNAVQSARLIGPSLMLVDMKLPKQKRDALLHDLRSASRGPIILLAPADTFEQVTDANQAGADECLIQPVNPAVLVVKAMAWLGHGQRSDRIIINTNATI
jgi:DNA-binding response OmpR family regulator